MSIIDCSLKYKQNTQQRGTTNPQHFRTNGRFATSEKWRNRPDLIEVFQKDKSELFTKDTNVKCRPTMGHTLKLERMH